MVIHRNDSNVHRTVIHIAEQTLFLEYCFTKALGQNVYYWIYLTFNLLFM